MGALAVPYQIIGQRDLAGVLITTTDARGPVTMLAGPGDNIAVTVGRPGKPA